MVNQIDIQTLQVVKETNKVDDSEGDIKKWSTEIENQAA